MATSGMRMPAEQVGGAEVTRMFTDSGGTKRLRGERLTREQVLAIPTRNREALVSSGLIREFPLSVAPATSGERFIVRRHDLKWDVVEGRKVNAEPLHSKAEAEALCLRSLNGHVTDGPAPVEVSP